MRVTLSNGGRLLARKRLVWVPIKVGVGVGVHPIKVGVGVHPIKVGVGVGVGAWVETGSYHPRSLKSTVVGAG